MDRRRGVRRGRRRASDRATDRRDSGTFLVPAVVANAPRACIAVQNRRIASRPSLHDELAPAMCALAFPTRSQRRRSGPRLLGLRAPDLKHRSLHQQSSATESWGKEARRVVFSTNPNRRLTRRLVTVCPYLRGCSWPICRAIRLFAQSSRSVDLAANSLRRDRAVSLKP